MQRLGKRDSARGAVLAALTGLMLTFGAAAPAAANDRGPWAWPVGPAHQVLAGFDPPAQRWLAGHRGVDLQTRAGQPVAAAGDGVITFAGRIAGVPVMTVTHGTLRTTYEPVIAASPAGTRVRSGQLIGRIGAGGHCGASCLHFGLLRGAEYLNPLALLTGGPPILKPLAGNARQPLLSPRTPSTAAAGHPVPGAADGSDEGAAVAILLAAAGASASAAAGAGLRRHRRRL